MQSSVFWEKDKFCPILSFSVISELWKSYQINVIITHGG